VVPEEIDKNGRTIELDAMGIKIDTLTPEQQDYLNSWQEGTIKRRINGKLFFMESGKYLLSSESVTEGT